MPEIEEKNTRGGYHKEIIPLIRNNISLTMLIGLLLLFVIGFLYSLINPEAHFVDPFTELINIFYMLLGSTITDVHELMPIIMQDLGEGAILTFRISIISLILGFFIAIIIAITMVSKGNVFGFKYVCQAYVDFIRSTPLLVQLLIVYLGIPPLLSTYGINFVIGKQLAGIIALTINTSAYQSEIIRGGIQAIPTGQTEAARALGLTSGQTMQHVILPQALRIIVPPFTNEVVQLLLNSSIVAYIGVYEITQYSQLYSSRYFIIEPLFFAAIFYFIIAYSMSRIAKILEIRLRIPGLGVSSD